MTTYQTTSLLSEIRDAKKLSPYALGYFQARLKNRVHQLVLGEYLNPKQGKRVTKADIARRLGKSPEQITRWLGAPGNWTLDTVSDLLLALGCELAMQPSRFDNLRSYKPTVVYQWDTKPAKKGFLDVKTNPCSTSIVPEHSSNTAESVRDC